MVERASLGSVVIASASVVSSASAVVEASVTTAVVSESAVIPSTTVAALAATAGSGLFAAVADRTACKVGIVAFRTGPIVVGWLATAASVAIVEAAVSASVVSVPAIVPAASAVVEASVSATVVSLAAMVSSVASAAVLTPFLSLFSGLFLGSNGHRDADQSVHVE